MNKESAKAQEIIEEKIEEAIENDAKEVSENLENEIAEVEELNFVEEDGSVVSKKSAHSDLVLHAKNSQESAKQKYQEYLKADEELEKTTANFLRQENNILKTTVNTSLELLNSLGVDSLESANAAVAEITRDNKEDLLHIKTPTKGSVKGFLLGLIGALATGAGMTAYGAKLANLPLNMATFMQKTNLDTIATKYSELLKIHNTPVAGYALIGVSSLLVGYILYKITTSIQKSRNVKYINNVGQNLQEYKEKIDNKIEKIHALSNHIDNTQLVMQKYDIILQEQNAKIRRMLFIEQPEEGLESLQRASKNEVEKTVLILDELLKLMNTPVNEDIEIREESNQRLHSANSVINEVIKKLYV